MRVQIEGASHFVERLYSACGPFQWARECLQNSLEAGAKRVEFTLDWQAVELQRIYRRVIVDDGAGMSAKELVNFFATLGAGSKQIGGVHDNFGVGAKVALLPWNPSGVVVISYKNHVGQMIWIRRDDNGNYELAEFATETGPQVVIPPAEVAGVDWAKVVPLWARFHGTTIILLGSKEHPNTVYGDPGAPKEADLKGLSTYLNTRFWDLPLDVRVTVAELRGGNLPLSQREKDDARRPNYRRIAGARFYLTDVSAADKGSLKACGEVALAAGKVKACWYLWHGERPQIGGYARRHGYLALRYQGELYEHTAAKVDWRAFGVVEGEVQQNCTIVLEPQPLTAGWGVHPDQSRARLLFTDPEHKGSSVPLAQWGAEFASKMPQALARAISDARAAGEGSITDEEYRKRLQDRFGARWSVKRWIEAKSGKPATIQETLAGPFVETRGPKETDEVHPTTERRLVVRVRKDADLKGPDKAASGGVPVDVPRYRFGTSKDFERPWHLACWVPNDSEGPTVVVNVDSPMMHDLTDHYTAQFASHLADEVSQVVRHTIGEIAVAKVAHAQSLSQLIPEEEIDREFRNEASLTVSLMGLIAEEAVIARRLAAKLGKATA